MSEKRILLASLLKPINDTRMYEKLGLSLCKLPATAVFICGYAAPLPASAPQNTSFHPIFEFSRLGFGRVLAQHKYFKILEQIKPDVLIVCTHELLALSYTYSRTHKVQLIYDVQENYALNLRSQHNYPAVVKQGLAWFVRAIEQFTAKKVSHFLLAEESYKDELPFIDDRFTILQNKFKAPLGFSQPKTPIKLQQAPLRLLYSGTISEDYGIFEALKLTDNLHQINASVSLTIIGYCANSSTLQAVRNAIKGKSYIKLIGGDTLVPHSEILQHIQQCNIGLLPYRPNPSTIRCIPTKLFEYMAYGLVIVVQQNPIWNELVQHHKVGLSIDFSKPNIKNLLNSLSQSTFYTDGIPENIFWETEEQKLIKLLR